MIDSNNLDVIRKNIKELAAVSDPDVINNLITNVDANTDAIGDINALIGSTPLPQGKTITSAIPYYEDVTASTNAYGLFQLAQAPIDKTISCQVLEPIQYTCETWLNQESDTTYSGYIHKRGDYADKLASSQCKVRIWKTN